MNGYLAERLTCVECGREQAADEHGWRAYLTTDEDEPAEAVVYCPDCAAREFGHRGTRGSAYVADSDMRPAIAWTSLSPSIESAVLSWRPGDEIALGYRTLRVVCVRNDDADQPPILVVENAA